MITARLEVAADGHISMFITGASLREPSPEFGSRLMVPRFAYCSTLSVLSAVQDCRESAELATVAMPGIDDEVCPCVFDKLVGQRIAGVRQSISAYLTDQNRRYGDAALSYDHRLFRVFKHEIGEMRDRIQTRVDDVGAQFFGWNEHLKLGLYDEFGHAILPEPAPSHLQHL